MPGEEKLRTTVSTKGQVILPKAIRRQRRWEAGTRLLVENTPEGGALVRLGEREAHVITVIEFAHP